MTKPIPKSTLLRFPLMFGGFLVAAGVAFNYRNELLGNMEQERRAIYRVDDLEGRKLIENAKREHQKLFNK